MCEVCPRIKGETCLQFWHACDSKNGKGTALESQALNTRLTMVNTDGQVLLSLLLTPAFLYVRSLAALITWFGPITKLMSDNCHTIHKCPDLDRDALKHDHQQGMQKQTSNGELNSCNPPYFSSTCTNSHTHITCIAEFP